MVQGFGKQINLAKIYTYNFDKICLPFGEKPEDRNLG